MYPYLNEFIQYCHNNIVSNKNAEVESAIEYLSRRNVKSSTMVSHKIGYCCKDDKVPKEVAFFGKDSKDPAQHSSDYKIIGKIIIPVYDEFSKIVGFATRTPSFESGQSWWNLARPFRKGEHLFLLEKARKDIFSSNKIYLVEGYMDSIILRQEGLLQTVGIMGTQLSARKVALIARYCNNVCVCMDSDKNQAGQKAQLDIIYTLRKFDFCESISIIEGLPIGEDPDVFVCKNGLPAFLKLERRLSDSEVSAICKQIAIDSKGRKIL